MSVITVTPVITASSAYAAGNLLGGKATLTNLLPGGGQSGYLRGITITDLANQKSAIDLVFFSANPSGTTFTDKVTLAVNAADLLNIIATLSVVTADYASFNSANAVATKGGLSVFLAGGNTLYMALVCRGTPTFASVSDLSVKLYIDS